MQDAARDGAETVVVQQQTADGRQDAVDGGDLVARRVEQLEPRQSGQLDRDVSETIVRDDQRTQTTEVRERRRNLLSVATVQYNQWLKWFCEAGGSPDEARLEQTPHTHSNPTNFALFRRKITLYRFNQGGGAHTIAGGLKWGQGG